MNNRTFKITIDNCLKTCSIGLHIDLLDWCKLSIFQIELEIELKYTEAVTAWARILVQVTIYRRLLNQKPTIYRNLYENTAPGIESLF